MSQIWLTYGELAQAFGGTPHEAREAAIENGWARAKGRDGVAHVRLTPTMAQDYLLRQLMQLQRRDSNAMTDQMVTSLRAMLPAPRPADRFEVAA